MPFPESELRNQFESRPDGSVGRFRSTLAIHEAIGAGALKRDYSRVRVPVLAFFPVHCSPHPEGNYACFEHTGDTPKYQPKDDQERTAIKAFEAVTAAYINRWKNNLRNAPGGVRIVDLPGAEHFVFFTREADVLRELRGFLKTL
jgi:hypothetical protein